MRYAYRLVGMTFIGFAAALPLWLSVAPAGATIVCPPNQTNPIYCINVPPAAQTSRTTGITGTRALLRGVAGPGVPGGDLTRFFFQFGRTLAYGDQTGAGTVGRCPVGQGRCPA